MPSFHDFRFLSTDGKHKVFARECTPDGEVRAVLQIAHGVAEHIYRYAPFMEFLADNGFVVVANDHLGHGKTAENEQELCFFAEKDGWNDVVSDMDQLHKLTAAKYPDVPYFLFGHSMGSFLTRTYIIDHPEGLKGVIISGTGQNPAAVVAAGKLVAKLEMIDNGPMYHSPKLDKLAFGSYNKIYDKVRTDYDWLCRDEAQVDKYIADPLCGFIPTCSLFRDMMSGIKIVTTQKNLESMNKDTPVYFMSGDMDPVGECGKGVKLAYENFKKAGMKDVSIKLYKDGRHEMLNELNKDEVYSDILAWINSKIYSKAKVTN